MPPRSIEAVATLVAVNITPIAGILLLGWSPAAVLISYFVDTYLGFGALVLLVMVHVTGDAHDRPIVGWKNWTKALIGLVFLGAIMAFPLAFPLWITLGDDPATWAFFSNREFLGALAVQCGMSVLAAVRMHRELKATSDDERLLAGRMFFLTARWIAMFVAMVTGIVPALGPTIGGFILIVIYGGASVYFELFPERAMRFVRGKAAKPVIFEGDLESRVAAAAARHPHAKDSTPAHSQEIPDRLP
jgi:uncharacterized protein DUF6498